MSEKSYIDRGEDGRGHRFVRITDYQRSKVYKAERSWIRQMHEHLDATERSSKGSPNAHTISLDANPSSLFYTFPSVGAVMSYLQTLATSDWMVKKYGEKVCNKLRDVKVRCRQGNKASVAYYSSISLAPNWGFRKDVVLHEFSHVIVNHIDGYDGGHGRLFAQTLLLLVDREVSGVASSMLRNAFNKQGVQYTGDDRLFVEQKVKKQESAANNGIAIFTRSLYCETSLVTYTIGRLPLVKVALKYVPTMEEGWGNRPVYWISDTYFVDGKLTRIHWERYYGKYAYFVLFNEDGSPQWYKFRMSANKFDFRPGGAQNYCLFTPAFIKSHTEQELKDMVDEFSK